MRLWMLMAVAALAGCPRGWLPGSSSGQIFLCPDPTACTQTNGTGVYYEEGGTAGIGPASLMITHFINSDTGVTFQGRFFDASSQIWRTLAQPGTVYRVEYPKMAKPVVTRVEERDTVPRWTLQSTSATGAVVTEAVTGEQLRNLTLWVRFAVPAQGALIYILDFNGPAVSSPAVGKRQPAMLHMRWRLADGAARAQPTSYCTDAAGHGDAVVFQHGIDVDPVTGKVSPAANHVTLSCSRGAPSTVYKWGYDHTADLFYFGAGIQMKRASYCADSQFYTVAGTPIDISDNLAINDNPAATAGQVEAWWTPEGASCLNEAAERRPDVTLSKQFHGVCNGVKLPPCQLPPKAPSTLRYLSDRPKSPPK